MSALNYKPPTQKRNLRAYLGLPENDTKTKDPKTACMKKPRVYIPLTAYIIRFAKRKYNEDEGGTQVEDNSTQKVTKQRQSKISDFPKRDDQNQNETPPIPHEVTIPATKRQKTKKVNSEIVLDMSEEKQNDIPFVIDVKMTMNLVQDKNDDDRNETECSSGGI